MAYVDSKGKRTAPKHASRPARKSKPPARNRPAFKPPSGDIASSGGDYGTRAAKNYSAKRAFRSAVRKTYAEQPTARRKQIAAASKHRPGPAAAAVRHEHSTRTAANRRATGTNVLRGVLPGFGQARQQEKAINLSKLISGAHAQSRGRAVGDTKSDLERYTAEAFKRTPKYADDMRAALSAGAKAGSRPDFGGGDFNDPSLQKLNTLGVSGGIGAGMGRLINKLNVAQSAAITGKALVAASDPIGTILGDPTYGKQGAKTVQRLGEELVDIPAQAVPDLFTTGESIYAATRKGGAGAGAKTAWRAATEFPKQIIADPKGTFLEHPGATLLTIGGGLHGVNRGLGSAARKTGAIPNYRPDRVFPNTALTFKEPTARGLAGGIKQTIQDRPIRQGKAPKRTMTEQQVRRSSWEDEDFVEQQRRVDRDKTLMAADKAVGKKPTVAHVLGAQNIVNNLGELRLYQARLGGRRDDLRQKIKAKDPDALANRAKFKVLDDNMKDISAFLSKPEIARLPDESDFPKNIRDEIESYKKVSVGIQDRLGEAFGQKGRVETARLMPYARAQMGADFKSKVTVDTKTNTVISSDMKKEIREELGVDEKGITKEEHDKRLAEYNERVKTESRVLVKDNKILSNEDIRAHMKAQRGPEDSEKIAALRAELTAKEKVEVGQLNKLKKRAARYKDGVLPAELENSLKRAQGRVDRVREDLARAERGISTRTIQLPKEQKFSVPSKEREARLKDLAGNVGIAREAAETERGHIREGQKLLRDVKGREIERMGIIPKEAHDYAARIDPKDLDAELTAATERVDDLAAEHEMKSEEFGDDHPIIRDIEEKHVAASNLEAALRARMGLDPFEGHAAVREGLEGRITDAQKRLEGKEKDLSAAEQRQADYILSREGLTEKSVTIPEVRIQQRISGKQGITEPAWLSQAPNPKSATAYFRNPNKAATLSPSGRTGEATVGGTLDIRPENLRESAAKAQGLLSAVDLFSKRLSRVAVRAKQADIPEGFEDMVVRDPDNPEVLTVRGQREAQEFADNYNEAHPNARVIPVQIQPFGGSKEQLIEFLNRANVDEGMARLAHKSMSDALEGIDAGGHGNFALIPEAYSQEMMKYLQSPRNPLMRAFGNQFRKVVLTTSPNWPIGNVVEGGMRAAVNKAGPRSWYTGHQILKTLKEIDPDMYEQLANRTVGGAHFGVQNRQALHSDASQFAEASNRAVRKIAHLLGTAGKAPGGKHALQLWNTWTDWIFNTNRAIENEIQTAMMGRAAREHLMSDKLLKLSKGVMEDAINEKLDVPTIAHFGREVDRMMGQYSKFSPTMKRLISHETPFIAWYLNALKFILKLPRDHPVFTATLASSYGALDEWRKDKGLGLFIEGHMPYFLQGSIPSEGGNYRFPYTPFSALSDPLGTPAGLVFPQYRTILNNMQGLDWKGDPIPGAEQDFTKAATEALLNLTGNLVPGMNQLNRYREKREGESEEDRIKRALAVPLRKAQSPQQRKSENEGGSKSKNPFVDGGGTSGGGSSRKSSNPFLDSSGQTTSKRKKNPFVP